MILFVGWSITVDLADDITGKLWFSGKRFHARGLYLLPTCTFLILPAVVLILLDACRRVHSGVNLSRARGKQRQLPPNLDPLLIAIVLQNLHFWPALPLGYQLLLVKA